MSETKEKRQARIALAKAIWRDDPGFTLPKDPQERQVAFQAVKSDLIKRARKMEVTLDRLGYTINPKV